MELVSILVINWNGERFIESCLDSISKQDYSPLDVIVIDNASSDGSVGIVEEKFPNLNLVKNEVNRGFAGAFNQGVSISKGDFIISLNPDVVLAPNFVAEMVKAARKDRRVGSVSGKLLRRVGGEEGTIDSTGHVIFKNRLARNRGVGEKDHGQYGQEEYIFGTCGAAALYKREMLEDIKLNGEYYDEDFFAFWEDIDLDWRAQLRGWKCIYTPRAVAYHYRGGIRLPRPRVIEQNNYRNRYFTIIKNDRFLGILKNLPQIIFTDFLKTSALLFRCPAALYAWIDILKLTSRMLKKRRKIQAGRVVDPRELEKRWFKKFDYRSWIAKHILFK